jgi:hypothetical protein
MELADTERANFSGEAVGSKANQRGRPSINSYTSK